MDWDEALKSNLFHQNLVNTCNSLNSLINGIIGLHSARVKSPIMAVAARLSHEAIASPCAQIGPNLPLRRLPAMRGTLHVTTSELAPILHFSTVRVRVRNKYSSLKRREIDSTYADKFVDLIVKEATGSAIPNKILISEIQSYLESKKRTAGYSNQRFRAAALVRLAWDKGLIVAADSSSRWDSEERCFIAAEDKQLSIAELNKAEASAISILLEHYILRYGPVTIKDAVWWTGVPLKCILNAIQSVNSIHESVMSDGTPVLVHDSQEHRALDEFPSIRFLAYEDPFLKGYFQTRHRYADQHVLDRIFHKTGEVKASILENGKITGSWSWCTRLKVPKVELYVANQAKRRKCILSCLEEHASKLGSLST